jgi:hypothetical protein
MGDDHHVSVGMLPIEAACRPGHALGDLVQGLALEGKPARALEIGLQLTREDLRDVTPGVAPPPRNDPPLGEVGVHLHRDPGSTGDLLGGAEGALEWRGPDRHHRARPEISADAARLLHPMWREAEAGEVGVDQVIWVVHLGVADEVDHGCHEGIVPVLVSVGR